ncbi:VWA domain-containing protein [Butyrivibrio sp. CB08]|uniref:vWA domain-containing protein n=1 Tax=Butyrivibrio sp. CB08 TaxID=2364879 RepID=UPI000EA922C9|nr:VWA domain-containing protein [Butyrivibrio sp. CB08]RKM61113.1 VWA domain-containing protein [Butyrivibrio sp. CB08]
MKKNYRIISTLAMTTMLTGTLAGCGGATAATEAMTAAESPQASYGDYSTEACEEPIMAAPKSAGSSLFDSFAATESACETGYYYDDDYCIVVPEYYNTESYDKPDENGFFLSQGQPLSTFAADVDTASYANVRRMIEDGYGQSGIPMESVRPEEFINYFSYDLKSPKRGEKFGVTTEVSRCPWNEDHELMFVGVKAEDKLDGQLPESNLVFLIDVSGSMDDEDKLGLLKKAFIELVDNLEGEGTVSIVTYASHEKVVLDGADFSDKRKIKSAIKSLEAGGATAGERGMEMAYDIAKENFIDGGNNRIIMATDGDLNVGISDPDELEKFITEKKDQGIYLSVLGFGAGNYKDDKMERLADCGNGNYSYIDSFTEARKVLVEEMTSTLVTVAKDVKFQIEFNPAVVNSYRLIGYENREMDAVDFNNDQKDGGELGSGHTVVALYEIVPSDSKNAIELKYQNAEYSDASDDYATIKIRYKEPEEDKSNLLTYVVGSEVFRENASENLRFAGLVSEFAMLLSDSDYSGSVTYKDIIKGYKELDNTDDYKDEFISLVRMVEKRS